MNCGVYNPVYILSNMMHSIYYIVYNVFCDGNMLVFNFVCFIMMAMRTFFNNENFNQGEEVTEVL